MFPDCTKAAGTCGRFGADAHPRRARLHRGPSTALSYPWKHFIGGHVGRLGTRDDVGLHQQYVADIAASARTALATVDPTPYFQKYGENVWWSTRPRRLTIRPCPA